MKSYPAGIMNIQYLQDVYQALKALDEDQLIILIFEASKELAIRRQFSIEKEA